MDLIKDWESILIDNLRKQLNSGYSFNSPPEWADKISSGCAFTDEEKEAAISVYLSNLRRFLTPKIREWEMLPNVEKDAAGLGVVEDLNDIGDEVVRGDDLTPRMSRSIKVLDKRDGALDDWGIYHFHLKPTGSRHVVMAMLRNDTIFAVAIREHNKWTDKSILETIQKDEPSLIDAFKIDAKDIATPLNEDCRYETRRDGINHPVEINGTYYMPIGGGYCFSGASNEAMQKRLSYNKRLKKAEQIIEQNRNIYNTKDIKLASIDDKTIIVVDGLTGVKCEVNISLNLMRKL